MSHMINVPLTQADRATRALGVDLGAPDAAKDRALGIWLVSLGSIALLAGAKQIHYLLFHTLAELFAVAVSLSIFSLAWASRKYFNNSYLTILGAAYATIGLVDVFHALTFRGMNLFAEVTPNYPTQFWLAARFIEALALLIAPLLMARKVSFFAMVTAFLFFGMTACTAIWMGKVPPTFVDGIGLTRFKIAGEFVIIGMLLTGLFLLLRQKHRFSRQVFRLVSVSVLLAIATELCFTSYVQFYDFTNEIGHFFRLASVMLAYLAIVVTGVRRPAELLFRQLKEKELQLTAINGRLEESEHRLNQAQGVAGVGSWYLDIVSGKLTWSDEAYRMFGVRIGTPLSSTFFAACIHLDDRNRVTAAWKAALAGADYDIEHRIVVDGQIRWVREQVEIQFSAQGQPLTGVGSVQNITERKKAAEAHRESEERFRNALEYAPIGMALLSLDDRFMQVNCALCCIIGYASHELLNISAESITHADDLVQERVLVASLQAGTIRSYVLEKRYIRNDGQIVWVQITGSLLLRDEKGKPKQLIKQVQDITERKRLEMQLERHAHTDFLTGLANRRHFLHLAARELGRASHDEKPFSIAMLDLDQFKTINDTHGHAVGDQVLKEFALICGRVLRSMDVVGRMGGDEFTIYLPETSTGEAIDIAERLRQAIAVHVIWLDGGRTIQLTASLGIASLSEEDTTIEDLLHRADLALYDAKRKGRNKTVFMPVLSSRKSALDGTPVEHGVLGLVR